MAKTIGARDRSKGRNRDETEDQVSKRVAKTAETRKANKRKKHDDERAATAHRKSGFFEKRVRKSADQPIDGDDTNDVGAGDDSNDDDRPMPDQEANHADDEGSDAGEDGELAAEVMLATFTATGNGVDAHVPPGVTANYDVADEGSGDIDEEGGGGGGPRLMLPPRQLCWRVRAVFVAHGGKCNVGIFCFHKKWSTICLHNSFQQTCSNTNMPRNSGPLILLKRGRQAHKRLSGTIFRAARILARRLPGRSRHAMPGAMETTIDAQTTWSLESRHLGEVREFGKLGRQPDVSEKTGNILWPTDGANGWTRHSWAGPRRLTAHAR